jgi:hypothetical protein
MKKNNGTYKFLMVFLLILFVGSLDSIAQQARSITQSQQYEEQLLMQYSSNNALLNETENYINLDPSQYEDATALINTERQKFPNNGNYVQVFINGNGNNVQSTQKEGSGNIMDLGIHGNSNEGTYLQQGSNNYIYDRINHSSGISHEINQNGNGLGIYNEGMQTIPMIINQKGQDMKLKIK